MVIFVVKLWDFVVSLYDGGMEELFMVIFYVFCFFSEGILVIVLVIN